MMHNWFLTKVKYDKTLENGQNKTVTEPYLVDALSHAEAEERIIKEMTPYISGEFTVSSVARAKYHELFFADDTASDRWYRFKLEFITLDERTGSEKKQANFVLQHAADFHDAVKKLDENMKGTMSDYVIASVTETPIMDVYPYEADPDVKPEFAE